MAKILESTPDLDQVSLVLDPEQSAMLMRQDLRLFTFDYMTFTAFMPSDWRIIVIQLLCTPMSSLWKTLSPTLKFPCSDCSSSNKWYDS